MTLDFVGKIPMQRWPKGIVTSAENTPTRKLGALVSPKTIERGPSRITMRSAKNLGMIRRLHREGISEKSDWNEGLRV